MATPLLSLSDMGVNLGDRWLLRHVDLSIHAGDRLALVGRNGAGKSTLMKLISGDAEPDEGSLWVSPGTNVAYLPQAPKIKGSQTLASYVVQGLDDPSQIHRAEAMLMKMGMDPARMTDGLSGGESRRASLARALVSKPEVLLLDEPTNHLDLPTIEWLEGLMKAHQGALIVISHDRAFLRSLGTGIVWIHQGKLRRRDGAFDQFEDWSDAILAEESVRLAKLDKKIAEETKWSRQGISARRKRNQGRLRELAVLRQNRASEGGITARSLSMETGPAEGGGQVVLESRDITVQVPKGNPVSISADGIAADAAQAHEMRTLVSHFNALLKRGDRIGIVGPNGSGKSSLVRVLLKQVPPAAGYVKLGFGLLPAYFDQSRTLLNPDATPWTTLCPDGGETVEIAGKSKHVTSYLRDFLFDDYKMTQRVGTMSGGEQNRLLLAKIFSQPHNFLVLDEPTNDLDMETIDLLQEVVGDYDGTVLIVSHDRDFLDRTVTSTLAFEDAGKIVSHAGGYSDYLNRRVKTEARQQAKAKKKSAAEKPRANRAARLSYNETFLLDKLPQEIAELESFITKGEAKLADMDYFAKDPDGYQKLADKIGTAKSDKAAKEDQWLEIEMKREAIENG